MIPEMAVLAAGSIAAHGLSASMHIINSRRLSAVERALKFQRVELTTLEIVSVASIVMQVIDEVTWRKDYKETKANMNNIYDNLSVRMDYINDRLNKLNLSTIEDKIDSLVSTESKNEGEGA